VTPAVASRYHPMLVGLHWLLAIMIVGLLCLGFFVLAPMTHTDPRKIHILIWHASGGMIVLVLMIVRLIIRLRSARPVAATIGVPMLDRLASAAHYGLYVIIFLMIASGWLTGFLISDVFAHPGALLPADFNVVPTFRIHAALAVILTTVLAAHVAAALYHQVSLRDGLFSRMWFGRRFIVKR
jgi:cytochrome b561